MTALEAARARGLETRSAADDDDLEALVSFCRDVPAELLELLRHSNGLYGAYGSAAVWPALEIVQRNRSMRSHPDFAELYWSFEQILFVGEDGGGDLFGYRILPSSEGPPDLYRWDHEDDSRVAFAPSLAEYLARRP